MLKIIIYLFFLASFNIAAGLIASIGYDNVEYIQTNSNTYMVLAVCLILLGDIFFLNMIFFKGMGRSTPQYYKKFDDILKKHYNGDNFDEAFKKAYKEWQGKK